MISGGPPEVAKDPVEVQGSADQRRATCFVFCCRSHSRGERVFRPWCAAIVASAALHRRKKQRTGLIFCGSL
ncbi:hypothetical protein MRB53_011131 [Persea americana]|uniref:Uncharacterized protein n=1 Tax=Persea americana TaxID=3435 RepID=A0ACC2LTW4_PERAE|nr:hypothetical protein MRB53_011131 [Persea americana]